MPRFYCNDKTLCLILISFLFLFGPACTTEPVETDILIPVTFSSIPRGMVLTSSLSDKLEIKIKGDAYLIDLITSKNINYPVDLYIDLEFDPAGDSQSIEPGSYLVPIVKSRIPMDPKIQIISFSPSYLGVQLENKVTRLFNVTVPYTGELPKGFIALEAACEPNIVSLTGAESVINSIEELKTKPVDLANADENFKTKIPLDIDPSLPVESSDSIIIATVPVQQQLVTKSVENIPIQVWNTSSITSIMPPEISIEIKGPFDILSNKGIMEQIYAFIDLNGLKPGVYARHAYINIPVDLIMTQADPKVFTVKIE